MSQVTARNPPISLDQGSLVWIPGGEFTMGSDRHYEEEAPERRVSVDGFWMDVCQVTNRQFARFVNEMGYVTEAEKSPDPAMYPGAPPENLVPGSMVFVATQGPVDLRDHRQWWRWVPGANWRHPYGPGSTIERQLNHPVVHVSWADVSAYAAWAGKALPSEAEWERAARGSFDGAEFTWGDADTTDAKLLANVWVGAFPYLSEKRTSLQRTAPVAQFPANDFGLFDMAGNVWEWTEDWWQRTPPAGDSGCSCCIPRNPRSLDLEVSRDPATSIPQKVVKGGSHLCHRDACFRYRPAARQPQMIDTGMSHVGFRCVIRP